MMLGSRWGLWTPRPGGLPITRTGSSVAERARQGPRTLIGLAKPGRMRLAARGRGRIRPAAALEATDARKAGRRRLPLSGTMR
jgi:hypothetical protein